jgi:hypothetical protein
MRRFVFHEAEVEGVRADGDTALEKLVQGPHTARPSSSSA